MRLGGLARVLWAVVLMAAAQHAAGQCSLPFRIDGEASTFEISGGGALGALNLTIEPLFEQAVGVLGVLELASEADCPQGPGGLAAFWGNATLGTRAGEALRVYPPTVAAQVPQVNATVNLTDLLITWRSDGIEQGGEGGPGGFESAVNLTLVNGEAIYDSAFLSGEEQVANFSTASSVAGEVAFRNGSRRLEVPAASFAFQVDLGAIAVELRLDGAIVGEVGVGCDVDCGPNGWCGEGERGGVGCECLCGWGGEDCAIPTGFCPGQDRPASTIGRAVDGDSAGGELGMDGEPEADGGEPAPDGGEGAADGGEPAPDGGEPAPNGGQNATGGAPDSDVGVPELEGAAASDGDSGMDGAEGDAEECVNASSVVEVRNMLANLLAGTDAATRTEQLGDLCAGNCGADERSRFDPVSAECTCADGWDGPDCNMCTTNAACNAFWDTAGGTCFTGFEYSGESTHKVYNCNATALAEGISGLSLGKDLKLTCNTTGPQLERLADSGANALLQADPVLDARILAAQDAGLDANSPFCDVAFDFLEGGRSQTIQCRSWGCEFGVGSTAVTCTEGVLCDCGAEPCSSTVEAFLPVIQSVAWECQSTPCSGSDCGDDNSARRCNVALGLFDFNTVCTARECTDPTADVSVGQATGGGNTISLTAILSLVPTAVVVAVAILLGIPAQALTRQMMLKPQAFAGGAQKQRPSGLSEVVFIGVSCSVPVTRRGENASPLTGHARPRDDDMESCSSADVPIWRSPSQQEALLGLNPVLAEGLWDKKGRKSVLRGITGAFHQGEVVGVMGPSGSGKTTFLSILSSFSRDEQRTVQGDIWVNGRKQGAWLKRLVAFVPQEDKILATLTVKEAVMVSAILRLPEADWMIVYRRTGEVMEELGLHGVANSLVGGVRGMRGISGGERRRVTIGMELITDPAILILDEPTSGLDSFTALQLMQGLKVVGDAGRIVVASLHQPAPAIVALLDKVLLLARGFQVYFGPPGDARAYFASLGLSCPESLAISEHMLQVVSDPHTLVTVLNAAHDAKAGPQGSDLVLGSKMANDPASLSVPPKAGAKRKFGRLATLVWRGTVDMLRNPTLFWAHLAMGMTMGLLGGVIFWDSELTIEGSQNRLGAFFFLLALISFSSLTTIDLLHSERDIAFREIRAGFYSPEAYIASKLILDALLLRLIPVTILAVPLNLMMGLQTGFTKFAIYLFTINTFNFIVGAMSMIVTIWSPTPGTTSLLMNTILLMNLLFSGFLVQWSSIAPWLRWIHYCCPFAYAFHALVLNEFIGLKVNFAVAGYVNVDNIDGEVFLRTLGIELGKLRQNVIVLLAFYFGFVAIALLSMRLATPGQWGGAWDFGKGVRAPTRRPSVSLELRRAKAALVGKVSSRRIKGGQRTPPSDEAGSAASGAVAI